MEKKSNYYMPVSCSFHDHLELLAIRKQIVEIEYVKEGEEEICFLETRIKDLFTSEQSEFILTEEGVQIRLDQIKLINGKTISEFNLSLKV